MMQEKHRIPRTRKKITTRIATNREMPCCMNTQKTIGEVALHGGAEVVERIGLVDEGGNGGVGCPA